MPAIVGAMSTGSLVFSDTFLVTMSISSILACSILAMRDGIYAYLLLAFIILMSHFLVRLLYFLVTICSSDLSLAGERPKWKFQSIAAKNFLFLKAL